MKKFACVITNPEGIHTRHAGLIIKAAKNYDDTVITITKGGTTIKASQLMKLISLGIKQGDEVTVVAEGPDEDKAIADMEKFFHGTPCADTPCTPIGEWLFCPKCGHKTRLKIRADTELKNFPLFCPKCRQESLVNVEKLNMSVIKEPDAKTQSR